MTEWNELEQVQKQPNGRSPLLVFTGLAILGVAIALLIFGNTLFSQAEVPEESASLQQVPNLDTASGVASLPSSSGVLKVGDPAPDFKLKDLENNDVALNDFHGQPVILNFWATWCAPCRIEMPELQAAHEKYRDDDLVILALNQDESPETVRSFFYDQFGLTFTPVLDVDQLVAEQYDVFNYPSTFFINGDGVITAIHRGPVLQSQIDGYLADTFQ